MTLWRPPVSAVLMKFQRRIVEALGERSRRVTGMTFNQLLLVVPDIPLSAAQSAYHHAVAGNWGRFRDYLRQKGIGSLSRRQEAYAAAQRGHCRTS